MCANSRVGCQLSKRKTKEMIKEQHHQHAPAQGVMYKTATRGQKQFPCVTTGRQRQTDRQTGRQTDRKGRLRGEGYFTIPVLLQKVKENVQKIQHISLQKHNDHKRVWKRTICSEHSPALIVCGTRGASVSQQTPAVQTHIFRGEKKHSVCFLLQEERISWVPESN